MTVHIRPENPSDHAAVFAVNSAAFPTDAEARLVNALRAQASGIISLVAVETTTPATTTTTTPATHAKIVGHILFSPVTLSSAPALKLAGLAPMAVAPEYQRKGIGSQLVRAGIDACRAAGYSAIIVLGHPEYYPRFGFIPASRHGLRCEYEGVPDEAYMALELTPRALANANGLIRYHPAFASVA